MLVRISSGLLVVFQIPSAKKKSAIGTLRAPSGPTNSNSAPSVIRTGGVSAE